MMSSFQKSCLQSALSQSGAEARKMMLECRSCFLDVIARLPCHHSITSLISHIIDLYRLGAAGSSIKLQMEYLSEVALMLSSNAPWIYEWLRVARILNVLQHS